MSKDKIIIHNLEVMTIIGVLPHERTRRQSVKLDLEITVDSKKAATSDDINNTIDYNAIAKKVTDYVANSQFQLIETLAENTAKLILDEFKPRRVKLHLHKPGAIANAQGVSIIITRQGDALNI